MEPGGDRYRRPESADARPLFGSCHRSTRPSHVDGCAKAADNKLEYTRVGRKVQKPADERILPVRVHIRDGTKMINGVSVERICGKRSTDHKAYRRKGNNKSSPKFIAYAG